MWTPSDPCLLCCRHQGLSYGQSVALATISAALGSTLLGALAVLGWQWRKARLKAQAEVAFEAALQDSGLGLDDAFEQVSRHHRSWGDSVGSQQVCSGEWVLLDELGMHWTRVQ